MAPQHRNPPSPRPVIKKHPLYYGNARDVSLKEEQKDKWEKSSTDLTESTDSQLAVGTETRPTEQKLKEPRHREAAQRSRHRVNYM